MRTIISFLIVILLTACGAEKKQPSTGTEVVQSAQSNSRAFKPVPNEIIMNIWNNCEMIDYIFDKPSFSMNQDEKNSIKANVTYITSQGLGEIPTGCKPIGRSFFQVAGDIVLEADIYCDKDCQFYVFFIDGKAAYGNYMNAEGVSFFTNMMNQAQQARHGMSGNG